MIFCSQGELSPSPLVCGCSSISWFLHFKTSLEFMEGFIYCRSIQRDRNDLNKCSLIKVKGQGHNSPTYLGVKATVCTPRYLYCLYCSTSIWTSKSSDSWHHYVVFYESITTANTKLGMFLWCLCCDVFCCPHTWNIWHFVLADYCYSGCQSDTSAHSNHKHLVLVYWYLSIQ